ncbi:hypothetical protein, partial [Pseudomonas sp. BF-R-01]|uniref:hypothetical protein n=1 Tax=Pseudomonas sp. BF-R-01 TaxID=2832365 RepID=UPI001CBB35B5
IKAFRVNEFWGEVTSASGGLGEGFFMAKILRDWELPLFVFQTKGGSCTQAGKTEEDQTRQTRRSPTYSRHNSTYSAEKAPHYVMCGDPLLRVFQTRSLKC